LKLAICAVSFCCALVGACAPPSEPSTTERAIRLLAQREHRSVEIRAIAEHRADGHRVVCGVFGYAIGEDTPLYDGIFFVVDGRLLEDPPPMTPPPLLAVCRAKLPIRPPIGTAAIP
jgi:hypothetical protein